MKVALPKMSKSAYYNPELYKKCPDLIPRDIYLATGNVKTGEDIEQEFNKTFKMTFKEKANFLIKNLKGKYNKCIITADAIKGDALPKYTKTRKTRKKSGIN